VAATDTAELRDDLHERLQAALGDAYVLGRELGGGMSRVFVAEDARLGRRVAVKVLRPDLAAGLSAHRFAREVRLAARLQHPHVVPLLAAGEVDGLPYYTMPFVGGESLRAQLQRDGALPVPAAVRLVRELADALAHAHAEGVVHRDLKPENVLLSGGHAVVTDFGVAKALASATEGDVAAGAAAPPAPPAASTASSTAFGIAVGTPAYMAPEQVAADPATDHRADLYALGLIAYEVLAGAHPFADRPPHAVLAAQLTEVPPPLASRHPDVPPALAAFIARLLAKRPEDRPQTAQEVVRTMERFASAAGGLTPPPAGRGRASRRAAAAVLVAGLVLAGVGTLARTRRGAPDRPASGGVAHAGAPLVERRVAVAPFTNQTGDTTLALLGGLTADWIAQGLGAAGFPDVVDPGTVRTTWQTAADVRGLARATGARLVVSGAYYVEGDSVRLLARVVDAADDRVLRALEPVSAPASAPRPALAVLRERVLGAVAALLDIGPDAWAVPTGLPPSLAAYRHAAAGNEHFGRYELREAAREYEAAYRLDSSYVQPLLTAGITQHLLGARATADSLFRMAARSRDHLAPADRYLLDALWAEVRGDLAGALRGRANWCAWRRTPSDRTSWGGTRRG
jgi:serine/threonine-protein kinase